MVGWTPNGKNLLIMSDRTGSQDLWLMPMAGGMAQGSPRLVKPGFGAVVRLGITSRGELYYGFGGSETDVYIVDVGPHMGETGPTAKKLALPRQGHNQYPNYSPDGKFIAYLSTPMGRGRIINIFSSETGRVRDLALALSEPLFPRWIPPDGHTLSVWGRDKEGRRSFYKVDVQTSDVVPIAEMDRGLGLRDGPAWAKDGKRFFYTAGIRSEVNMKTSGSFDTG